MRRATSLSTCLPRWFVRTEPVQGTADAIFQNINLIEQSDPHLVAIFGGDHIWS